LGAATGAVVGSQVVDDDDKALGIIGGLIVGGVVGGLIGKAMDNADEACMGHALEYAADGAPVHWRDPNGYDYNVVPQATYQAGGRYCRNYTTTVVINGAPSLAGTACRRPTATGTSSARPGRLQTGRSAGALFAPIFR
jgi:surface antigen